MSDDVAAKLRAVSALRKLCVRLPHVPTPTELGRLKRFHELVAAPEQATEGDIEAVIAGWSSWWRQERLADLAAMVGRLPRSLIESDRRLAAFATASQALSR